MPTKTYKILRRLAERLEAGDVLKISTATATFSQRGVLKRMGVRAVSAYLDQAPITELARKLNEGQILRLTINTHQLIRWGTVQATGLTAIAVRLNRRAQRQ